MNDNTDTKPDPAAESNIVEFPGEDGDLIQKPADQLTDPEIELLKVYRKRQQLMAHANEIRRYVAMRKKQQEQGQQP